MKKVLIITAAAITAVVIPTSIYAAKRLDTSSVAPTIISDSEEWSKKASISVSTDATFGGSGLDHYEYCISATDSAKDCVWKTSSVNTVRVRNLGTSYIWFRGVSKYGVISDISNYVVTRIDRTKPEATAEITATTSTITITVTATDESDIKSYEYSINNSEYVTDGENHTFDGLSAGTTYNIKIKTTDLAGNSKYLSYEAATVNNIITNRFIRAIAKNSRSPQSPYNVAKVNKHERPERNNEGKDSIEKREEKTNEGNAEKNGDEQLTGVVESNEQTDDQADTDNNSESEEIIKCEDSIAVGDTETENNAEDINNEENSSDQEEPTDAPECIQAQTPEDNDDDQGNLTTSEQNEEDENIEENEKLDSTEELNPGEQNEKNEDMDENEELDNIEELNIDDNLIEKEDDSITNQAVNQGI